jgi:hypothetical protein
MLFGMLALRWVEMWQHHFLRLLEHRGKVSSEVDVGTVRIGVHQGYPDGAGDHAADA